MHQCADEAAKSTLAPVPRTFILHIGPGASAKNHVVLSVLFQLTQARTKPTKEKRKRGTAAQLRQVYSRRQHGSQQQLSPALETNAP